MMAGNLLSVCVTDDSQSPVGVDEEHWAKRSTLLAAIIENTPECLKLVTAAGELLDMNPAGLTLIEADDLESVLGANVYDLIAPEHLDNFREMNERVCQGETETLQFEIIGLKGTRRWMSTTAVPQMLPNGTIAHLAITRDISAEVRQREALEKAKQLAVSANVAKSEFLANMSHELRTPMTAILGFSEILLEMGFESDVSQMLRTICDNGRHLMSLLNDILDLSKIEAGKLVIERVDCSPQTILHEVNSLMQERAKAKRLALTLDINANTPETIHTDPLRLRQILINIVGNAIKFTESGSVRIHSRLSEHNSGLLEVQIADTGIGIASEDMEHLFARFAQVDASSTRRFGGTGLGLAISKWLATALGGDIDVTSQVGVGSTFTMTVDVGLSQIAVPVHKDGASHDSAPGTVAVLNTPLQGRRILVAEDGLDNQRLIRYILTEAGAEVVIVSNGRLAVEAIAGAHAEGLTFDAVLMDMQMPVLDGYLATRYLRAEGYGGVIIALTANAMSDDRDKCIEAGCNDYASKPFKRTVLIERLRNAIS